MSRTIIKPDVHKLNFEARKKKIYKEINDAIDECTELIMDGHLSPDDEDFYSSLRETFQALLSVPPKTNTDLDELEWMFNGGELRSEEDCKERIRQKNEKEFRIIEAQKNGLQSELTSICFWLILAVAPCISGAIAFRLSPMNPILLFFISLPFTLLGCYFVFMFLVLVFSYLIEMNFRDKFRSNVGHPAKINTSLALSTLLYGVSIFNFLKKKKK